MPEMAFPRARVEGLRENASGTPYRGLHLEPRSLKSCIRPSSFHVSLIKNICLVVRETGIHFHAGQVTHTNKHSFTWFQS